MQNLVVCFAGGSGGFFVANLCQFLLYKKTSSVSFDGSYHETSLPSQKSSYLLGWPVDLSSDSFMYEYNTINNLPNLDIICSHFRNLALLQKNNKRIIYIDFQSHHVTELKSRLHRKLANVPLIETQYNVLAGVDWPTWKEYLNGAKVDELDSVGKLKDSHPLDDWYYILPTNQDNICKIDFEDILSNDYTFVDKLADFLNVTAFDKNKIYAIVDEYRNNQ